MTRKYKISSLGSRGKNDDSVTDYKSVNIAIDYRTYCRMKVVSANTGKPMKQLLVESFRTVHGEATDEDVARVKGDMPIVEEPPKTYQTEVYDVFTGVPIETIISTDRPKIENPVAAKFFTRQM